MNNKYQFRVAAISSNNNSFGLRGHILMNRDGLTYQVARSDYNGQDRWSIGQIITSDMNFRFTGTELRTLMAEPPISVVEKVWGECSVN